MIQGVPRSWIPTGSPESHAALLLDRMAAAAGMRA